MAIFSDIQLPLGKSYSVDTDGVLTRSRQSVAWEKVKFGYVVSVDFFTKFINFTDSHAKGCSRLRGLYGNGLVHTLGGLWWYEKRVFTARTGAQDVLELP